MALIDLFSMIFGSGRNVVAETAEVFRVNAEKADARGADIQQAALAQLAAEFAHPRKGLFDRVIDGLNRVPRPAMALGVLALFVSAMTSPIWFAERMQGIALVPEPLWWLLFVIVGFYFGARHQTKTLQAQEGIARTLAMTPQVMGNLAALDGLRRGAMTPATAATGTDAGAEIEATEGAADPNPALDRIMRRQGGSER
jgi:hypothetical protein